MLGYPYTYNDYLSEKEAMQRRVDLFDKILFRFLGRTRGRILSYSLPLVEFVNALRRELKMEYIVWCYVYLLFCALFLCSKEKPLIIACSSVAAYVVIKLDE